VIGVMAPRASSSASTSTTPPSSRRRARQELFNREGVDEINLAAEEGVPSPSSPARQGALIARHGREDFTIITQEEMLKTLSNILNVLTMAVGALGGISLLVGGVGIVTIMTIAVTERTSEIGLLVALGAPRRTILALFLGEAVALSALGGLSACCSASAWRS
jgi:putative ABC transport system permease protein